MELVEVNAVLEAGGLNVRPIGIDLRRVNLEFFLSGMLMDQMLKDVICFLE